MQALHEHSIVCLPQELTLYYAYVSSVTISEGQLSRRDKFRAYMQAFNPTAPAPEVIEAGLVFEDLHQSLYRNLPLAQILSQAANSFWWGCWIREDNRTAPCRKVAQCSRARMPLYIDVLQKPIWAA